MAEYHDREHFIPIRRFELIDMLCADPELPADEREPFRQFCQLASAICHYEYYQRLEKLKAAYAPFDPDADTKSLVRFSAADKERRLNDLFIEVASLMERANFRHLSREDLEPTLDGASDWGIKMDVDFRVFERIAIFARGDTVAKRTRRRLRGFYRQEETQVPVYQRLGMILKLKPHRRLGKNVDTNSVYLKVFKDIPKLDLDMLLPGARVHMSYLDQGKIGFPLLSGLGMAFWNIAGDITTALFRASANPSLFVWGIATGALGYGTKSFYSYQGTKQRYHLTLTESLYYQNLDSNAGVLVRLLDEGEEQDCRETILAYYSLWRHAGEKGWTSSDLDDYIEADLERRTGVKVDFEIDDALAKLEKLGIVTRADEHYCAVPLPQALQQLDYLWDNYFKYNNPEPEMSPMTRA